MGTVTDKFADLTEVLRAEYVRDSGTPRPALGGQILIEKLLRPLLPAAIRVGPGTVVDVKDREVGLFDAVGCAEAWPPIGTGSATTYLLDGVAFVVQARDWASSDLTQFGELAQQLKGLGRSTARPLWCGAVSFNDVALAEIRDFLASPAGSALDGMISLGSHVVIRNTRGTYGDPATVPFVTERGSGESLKSFAFALVHAAQSFLGIPFGLSGYQHL